MVCVHSARGLVCRFPGPDSLAFPVSPACGFKEGLGPGDLDTATCLRHLRDFAAGDGVVESPEEGLREICLLVVE